MKAVVLHEIGKGGPDGLRYEDAPTPEPGPGEVVVKLRAAALNRRDVFVTYGMYPGAKPDALPVIPGSDGSGEVHAVGEGVSEPEVGVEVVINPALEWGDDIRISGKNYRILGLPEDGTYAEYVKVPADHVYPKPRHLTHEEAAALPLAALTAYRALVTRGEVESGQTVVVPGIGGGVATFLVQIASTLGARVFVTSGSDGKIEKAKELGAEGGVNYKSEGWQKELRSMTGPVDLSVDSIGGEVFDALLSVAKPGGRIVTFGATAGPVPKLVMPKIFLKQLDVLGTAMGSAPEFADMLKLYEEHDLRPVINERFRLEEAAQAMRHMEEGMGMGKIILDIA
ncbi:NADPH:quinone reductase and related Zn-dependent oxidoreductase [Rubrobacter radiotolerans]|uniref:NADPH:quinone reductase and related Zn-dependent oxidoreductase n=1 Tax=Rubrobacter radiotolerans TaxID=42256 RepID=A0A023X567_RUBRA|nr:zinc-binding dehydrogenase [Rubrobacter radiotolerans]AHY47130.1 NADPH:quinone reductase and related Zn-dependent oxidoreductase [Rubrobacter radiotolerans]MDX5894535.1 zinc-binding dehydrogenase [Rubrobacter radiotolerans]SMC06209.1 NADPH:quinone reductase [Rubrobacter radiotolerans DSM 5868]